MKTFDNEELIFDVYRNIPSHQVRYMGNFFRCYRVDKLTRSKMFAKSWINSSSKSDLPPDFHNDKHKIMMEFMRVDDCIDKHHSSFKRQNDCLRGIFGNTYKKDDRDLTCFVVPDTHNDDYNYRGYIDNFRNTLMKHSAKIQQYRENYPKCKSIVLFVCDEANNYIEVANENDLKEQDSYNNFKIHYAYADSKIVKLIKDSNADFVIWFGLYKEMFVNNRKIFYPKVVIYDVKHCKHQGLEYKEDLMLKVTKE